MQIRSLVQFEVNGFLCALAPVVVYKLLTRRISLRGILLRKDGTGAVSPERIQLLVATLSVCAAYWSAVVHGTGPSPPELRPEWLYVFGASSGVYAGVKAWTMRRLR